LLTEIICNRNVGIWCERENKSLEKSTIHVSKSAVLSHNHLSVGHIAPSWVSLNSFLQYNHWDGEHSGEYSVTGNALDGKQPLQFVSTHSEFAAINLQSQRRR
jgi:hypothetical protein